MNKKIEIIFISLRVETIFLMFLYLAVQIKHNIHLLILIYSLYYILSVFGNIIANYLLWSFIPIFYLIL